MTAAVDMLVFFVRMLVLMMASGSVLMGMFLVPVITFWSMNVWLLMAVTRNAGASVHHTVLLWPFPQFFIALAIGAEWPGMWRRMAMAAVGLLVAWNLMVLGSYYARLARNGGTAAGPRRRSDVRRAADPAGYVLIRPRTVHTASRAVATVEGAVSSVPVLTSTESTRHAGP